MNNYGISDLSVRICVINGRMYKRLSRRNDTTRHEWNQYYVYRVDHGFVFLNDNVHKSRIAQIDEAIKSPANIRKGK